MKKLITTAFAAVMAITGVSASAVTASAAPVVPLVQSGAGVSDALQVQYDGRWGHERRRIMRRNWDGGPRFAGPRYGSRSGFYMQGGSGWYNGHRGYRSHRHGYRRHGDWWFPAGAFIAGAIIGGALSDPGPTYYEPPVRRVYRGNGMGQSHVQWCYDRYRSYRAYDNTFQPYNGPRQQCWSPYS